MVGAAVVSGVMLRQLIPDVITQVHPSGLVRIMVQEPVVFETHNSRIVFEFIRPIPI